MAFLRRGTGDKGPGSSLLSRALLKTLRWAAIPCLGVALASWSVATLAGLHSAATLAYTGTIAPSPQAIVMASSNMFPGESQGPERFVAGLRLSPGNTVAARILIRSPPYSK